MAETPRVFWALVVVLDQKLGAWCQTCSKPSGHETTFVLELNNRTPRRVHTVGVCDDCGGEW